MEKREAAGVLSPLLFWELLDFPAGNAIQSDGRVRNAQSDSFVENDISSDEATAY